MDDIMYFEAEQGAGIVIGGEGEFTPTDKKNLDLNTKTRHTHENKTVLDGITGEQVNKWDGYEKSKEDTSNKVTELSESSTNEEYPTAKAVTEYVDNSEKEAVALLKKKSIPYTTATGCTISISDHLEGESVIDCKIYGNSVQNGTPSPDNPVEIQTVGDLVTDEASEYYGKYDIPIVVNDTITHIYLNKPLRKVGEYADYVDFENHKVVRQINSVKFDQTSYWTTLSGRENLVGTSIENSSVGNGYPCLSNISGFEAGKYSDSNYTGLTSWSSVGNTLMWREDGITVDTFKERLATTPMTVYYILATPTEEPISLPELTTPKASVANVSIHTTIQPSNISLTYYKGINKVVDGIGGLWGLDLPLIKTITLQESVTSIDILSKAEGIELQEFTVLLFIKALGDAVESNLNDCVMCLRANGGGNYFGHKGGYYFHKENNSFAFWHTKIYNKQFALTDLYRGRGTGNGGGIPYMGSQGLADATTAKYSSYTSFFNEQSVDNLNIFISSSDVSRGAIIPQGSMIFLLGR